jgi:high-affinity iron transporter
MGESLLILVREGFEASLIVAIVFAYLRRTGRLDLGRYVWVGVAAAVGLSVLLGVVLHLTVGDLRGAARMRAFAAIAASAAAVLTWMVFWMRRQSRAIKGELEHKIDDAIHSGAGRARHDARRVLRGAPRGHRDGAVPDRGDDDGQLHGRADRRP